AQRPAENDSDTATEKLKARDIQDENAVDPGRRRRTGGGGLSAQDLLRREGRRI
ncbi:MmpL protein, partial [Mycobacterium kiyosense]